ncbi:hypothetical protein R6Q57_008079 [Mikania cordata]
MLIADWCLDRLQMGEVVSTIPTIGFNVETVQYNNIKFQVWDLDMINGITISDLPGALDDAAVTESLELHKIKNRQWSIFKTSAIKGEGLFEGLDW